MVGGDTADEVEITPGPGADELIVTGLAGTLVNGAPGSVIASGARSLRIEGHGGSDVFDVAGVAPERRTAATVAACEEAMAAGLRLSYPETLRVIKLLKLRGVAIGIISNHSVSPSRAGTAKMATPVQRTISPK